VRNSAKKKEKGEKKGQVNIFSTSENPPPSKKRTRERAFLREGTFADFPYSY